MDHAHRLEGLPTDVRIAARIDANGEVAWPRAVAAQALDALAAQGAVVLGVDLRSYGSSDGVFEVAWASFEPTENDPEASSASHRAALNAIRDADADPALDDLGWVLVTWTPASPTRP